MVLSKKISSALRRPTSILPRRKRREAAAPHGPVVVLIHGLSVPRIIMWRMARLLSKKYGRRTINIGYNSWHHDIPEIAEQISRTLTRLNIKEYDCVTHSMGAVLLRWAANNQPMPKLRRAVLVTPPNSGACIADFLCNKLHWGYPAIWGQSGLQLRRDDMGLAARAGLLPGAEVGVIAGGSGTPHGLRNILRIPFPIKGDNDGIVAVEETILPGMKDFILLNHSHTISIFSAQTAHMTNLFLEHGIFRPRIKEEG